MQRNPKWTKDELILALELFLKVNPLHTSEKHLDIIALSDLLNRLPIHSDRPDREKFRNPNGVYMKLCNFLRLDPSYTGKGLDAGSKLDEEVWNEYAANRPRLTAVADAIRNNYNSTINSNGSGLAVTDDEEFPEGKVLEKVHKLRERNASLTRKKKKSIMDITGMLACEVCGFDFAEKYGEIGIGFCECHHIIPVSEIKEGHKTKLSELAVVCANCHRMLHKTRPWLTTGRLKEILS